MPSKVILPSRFVSVPITLALSLVSTGCGGLDRQVAKRAMSEGQPVKALAKLEPLLKESPKDPELRRLLLTARAQAVAKLSDEAARAVAESDFAAANAALKTMQDIDPSSPRLIKLRADLDRERDVQALLTRAEQFSGATEWVAANRAIDEGLQRAPNDERLLRLKRRSQQELQSTRYVGGSSELSETRPISIDFREAPLRQVLDAVSRFSGLNFVIDKDVRPDVRVTVFLQSASVEDTLDLIVSSNQLIKKVLDSRTVLIYPNTPDKLREFQEQVVRVFYLNSADAKSAATFLRTMLKIRDPFVDERSNMIALREPPDVIRLAERALRLFDAAEPEVMLELEVLEVRSTRLAELGIQIPNQISLTPLPPAAGGGLTVGNLRSINSDRVGVSVSGVLLNLRREAGDFEVLANPRVRAKNKEKAKILIGTRLPVVTTTSSQSGFVSDSISYVDVGLKLDLEPQISIDDDVSIRMALEVSSLSRQIRTPSGSLAYEISTRNAGTVLRLRDGETQVLAGLVSKEERTSAVRIPGLGDIPGIGRLFSSTLDDGQRTELVLAVTPRIVRNIRRSDPNEAELWVGTETYPRLRPIGARVPEAASTGAQGGERGVAASAQPPGGNLPGSPPAQASMPLSAQVTGVLPGGAGSAVSVPTSPPAAVAAPGVRVSAPSTVKLGEEFTVEVSVASAAPLRGLTIGTKWPLDRATLVSVSGGTHMQAGAAASVSQSLDPANGVMRLAVMRPSQAEGVTGQGPALQFKMRPMAPGKLELSFVSLVAEPSALNLGAVPPALVIEVTP